MPTNGRKSGYIPPNALRNNDVLNERRKAKLIKEFDQIDLNGDGVLDYDEIKTFMEKQAKKKDPKNKNNDEVVKQEVERQEAMLKELLKELDLDGDGSVTKQEFCDSYINKHRELELEKYNLEEEKKDLELKRDVLAERELQMLSGRATRVYDRNLHDLKVAVVEARKLSVADAMVGTSDPYMLIRLGGQVCKTTIKRATLNPIFKETFMFNKFPKEDMLLVEVYDYDAYKWDDIIGIKRIDLNDLKINSTIDKWYDLEDRDGNMNCGKIRLILQLVEHTPPDFKKETQDIERLIMLKEQEIHFNEEKREIMEKPFALFEVEKQEQLHDDADVPAGSVEKALSGYMLRFTKNGYYLQILLAAMYIYAFFILIVLFYRPNFADTTVCSVGFYILIFIMATSKALMRVFLILLILSILYDIGFFLICLSSWWGEEPYDGNIEQGLRRLSIIFSFILFIIKLVITVLVWHAYVNFYELIQPEKEELHKLNKINMRAMHYNRMYGPYGTNRDQMNPYGAGPYGAGYGGRDRYGRQGYPNGQQRTYVDGYGNKYESRVNDNQTDPNHDTQKSPSDAPLNDSKINP